MPQHPHNSSFYTGKTQWLIGLLVVTLFASLGYAVAVLKPWQGFHTSGSLYSADKALQVEPIGWQDLMGEQDKQLLADLQRKTSALMNTGQSDQSTMNQEQQLLASVLKAQTWQGLDGYQINSAMEQRDVSIPGFLVPLEVEGQQVKSFFVVPYFGACLHYPPPPPNQMFYVQLPGYMPLPAIDKPYLFSGTLTAELFEDPLGTSAWSMEVVAINHYAEQADDAREH